MSTKDLNLKLRLKSTLPPELDALIQKVIVRIDL
jgi:hypothetical protein